MKSMKNERVIKSETYPCGTFTMVEGERPYGISFEIRLTKPQEGIVMTRSYTSTRKSAQNAWRRETTAAKNRISS